MFASVMGREIPETILARVCTRRAPSPVERAREYKTACGNTARATFRRFQLLGTTAETPRPNQPGTRMNDEQRQAFNQRLGAVIAGARQFRALAPAEFAARMDITPARLQRIESGEVSPTIVELERIAAVLELPLAQFLEVCVRCEGG